MDVGQDRSQTQPQTKESLYRGHCERGKLMWSHQRQHTRHLKNIPQVFHVQWWGNQHHRLSLCPPASGGTFLTWLSLHGRHTSTPCDLTTLKCSEAGRQGTAKLVGGVCREKSHSCHMNPDGLHLNPKSKYAPFSPEVTSASWTPCTQLFNKC